ncbi:MAG: lysophospholipid acyltransferase family protein [Limibacillus sp.]|jgi:Kdo2-lipid IVA lauroyltransferase/acyltransferase
MSETTPPAAASDSRLRRKRPFARYFKYPAEALAFGLWMGLMRLLPVDRASRIGGSLARRIGPHMGASKRVERNLKLALPDLDAAGRGRILLQVWEELGRTAAEYPHLTAISKPENRRILFEGVEKITEATAGGKGALLVSGHFANFEILNVAGSRLFDPFLGVIRTPNNKHVSDSLERMRGGSGGVRIAKKDRRLLPEITKVIRRGGCVGILVDQKLTGGLMIDFMGHAAETTQAPAQLALRLDCPVFVLNLERLEDARFKITVTDPILPDREAPRAEQIQQITRQINDKLSGFVRENPGNWFWLHRRWPKAAYGALQRENA